MRVVDFYSWDGDTDKPEFVATLGIENGKIVIVKSENDWWANHILDGKGLC